MYQTNLLNTSCIKLLYDEYIPKTILDIGAYYHQSPNQFDIESLKYLKKDMKIELIENDYYDDMLKNINNIIINNKSIKNLFIKYDEYITTIKNKIETYETNKKYDLIFCQNILHFVDVEDIKEVLIKLEKLLNNKGVLYIRYKDKLNKHSYIFDTLQKICESNITIHNDIYTNLLFKKS